MQRIYPLHIILKMQQVTSSVPNRKIFSIFHFTQIIFLEFTSHCYLFSLQGLCCSSFLLSKLHAWVLHHGVTNCPKCNLTMTVLLSCLVVLGADWAQLDVFVLKARVSLPSHTTGASFHLKTSQGWVCRLALPLRIWCLGGGGWIRLS